MKRFAFVFVLCSFLLTLSAATVWQNPAPVRVGHNVAWNRCGIPSSDNGMVYAWTDSHRGGRDVYAQKINAQGLPVWTVPVLLDNGAKAQFNPVITRTSDNCYIIVYVEYQNEDTGILKAQKLDNGGTLLWTAGLVGRIVCNYDQRYYYYDVIADNAGGAYVAWIDTRSRAEDVYGQRLSEEGGRLWNDAGVPLAQTLSLNNGFSLAADNNGGFYIASGVAYSNLSWTSISRVIPSGLVAWTRNIQTGIAIPDAVPQVVTAADNSAFLVWPDFGNDYHAILLAQRVTPDGNFIWNTPALIVSSVQFPYTYAPFRNQRMVATPDSAFIIVWEDYYINPDWADLYAQKLDLNGNRLWAVNGVPYAVGDNHQYETRLVSDLAGGCYVAWQDMSGVNTYTHTVLAQHLLSDGSSGWQANGMPLSTATGDQREPLVRFSNGFVYISWMSDFVETPGITYQMLTPGGTQLLEAGGRSLIQGISGSVLQQSVKLFSRPGGSILTWVDDRHTYNDRRLYFQFLDAGGTPLLEPNGRAVSSGSISDYYEYSVAFDPAGQFCLVWPEENRVKAQLIDASGNRLWGDTGTYLTQTNFDLQTKPLVSWWDGAFYFAWAQMVTQQSGIQVYNPMHVFGQKLVNGVKQWGEDGILISQPVDNDDIFDAYPEQLTGRYYTWTRTSWEPDIFGCMQVYTKLLDASGNAAPGWSAFGLSVSTYQDWGCIQRQPSTQITSAGLFVCWQDMRTDYLLKLYGQLLSPQGERLWNPLGVELSTSQMEVTEYFLLPGDDIILAWTGNQADNSVILTQKFSLSGMPLWGTNPVLISPSANSFYNSKPVLARFANGALVAAWDRTAQPGFTNAGYSDLAYRYLTPDGVPQGPLWGYNLANQPDMETTPVLCASGSDAYVAWVDSDRYCVNPGRDGITAVAYNLFAQKLTNEVVANEDEVVPSPLLTLEQNTPNPFSAATTIRYNLPAKGNATLEVYNIKGQKVRTLLNAEQDKGNGSVVWEGKDDSGKTCANGVYYYRLTSASASGTRKLVLIK